MNAHRRTDTPNQQQRERGIYRPRRYEVRHEGATLRSDSVLAEAGKCELDWMDGIENGFVVIGHGDELHERIKAIANKRAIESSCFGGQ